jgi:hypothetical protein
MKSRLLIRAFCVGAALLVPAGGLTLLGVGTAGATTATVSGTIKLGALGTATIPTKACGITGTATHQCSLAGIQATVKTTLKVTVTTATLLILVSGGAITGVTIKAGGKVTITGTGVTVGFNGCKITTLPKIKYTKSGSTWLATTVATTGVAIAATACTTRTTLGSDITGHKLSSSLTV